MPVENSPEARVTWVAAVATYFGYALLIAVGHIRDFFGMIFKPKKYRTRKGYAPLLKDFEDFYTRRLYRRIQDSWNRPISSCPAVHIKLLLRENDKDKIMRLTGEERDCINMGSYNYLGFADPNSPTKPDVLKAVDKFGISTGSNRMAAGTTRLHYELEKQVARYIGKPAAMVFGMGFGTNSVGLSSLVGKGCMLVSDSKNHTSIVVGARLSGATIRVFEHNNMEHLESVIKRGIVEGQPRTHRPWRKILIVVEGIYSMEGEICPLRKIVALKNKYKCFLYVDEAHSVGALGKTGRGVCEHTGVDPNDVDILMGTFTKSFGSIGGYIAGSEELVAHLRRKSPGFTCSASISPPACQQIISSMKIISGEMNAEIGRKKLNQLAENSAFFRNELNSLGLHVIGDEGSPVVIVMLYAPSKISAFSRYCLERGLAVVVVGFPATSLLTGRVRFCLSAGHTRKDLKRVIEVINEVADLCFIKYDKPTLKMVEDACCWRSR